MSYLNCLICFSAQEDIIKRTNSNTSQASKTAVAHTESCREQWIYYDQLCLYVRNLVQTEQTQVGWFTVIPCRESERHLFCVFWVFLVFFPSVATWYGKHHFDSNHASKYGVRNTVTWDEIWSLFLSFVVSCHLVLVKTFGVMYGRTLFNAYKSPDQTSDHKEIGSQPCDCL